MVRSGERAACRGLGRAARAARPVFNVFGARRALGLLAALAALAPARNAGAQSGSAGERVAAEALFREALQLMGDGNYSDACPKLAESQRLDPGLGTLVNLALCHEAEGKTASAWAEFNEAASLARQNKRPDRERVARAHIRSLEPKLARLVVRVSPEARAMPGLEVLRDGVVLKEGVWGSPIPVDPGRHEVNAIAPGYEAWSAVVEIPPEPGQHEATVPELAKKKEEPPPAATPPAAPPAVEAKASASAPRRPFELPQRTVGFVVGGAGAAALLVGGYFGLRALGKAGDVDERCPNKRCADAGAIELNDEAGRAATVSNIALGVGLVGLGAGALLVLTAPPDKPAAGARAGRPGRWLAPGLGPGQVSLRLGGVW